MCVCVALGMLLKQQIMCVCVALGMLVKQQSNERLCGVGYVSKTTKQCAFVRRWVC